MKTRKEMGEIKEKVEVVLEALEAGCRYRMRTKVEKEMEEKRRRMR